MQQMDASGDDIFKQAMGSFQAGRLDDAERQFETLLGLQPNHVAALNILGVLLASRHKYAEAERRLRAALRFSSNSDATLCNYGIVLKGLGRSAEALDYFSKALAINPAVAETWNNCGTTRNDLKQYEAAIADFDRAIALRPGDPAAYLNKAISSERLNRHTEAVAAYDKAVTLAPNLAEAWLGRGHVLAKLRRHDEASAAYDRVLALQPNNVEAWLGHGNVFYDRMRYNEAWAAYLRILESEPGHAGAWLGCGNALTGLERSDEALAAYGKALERAPGLAGAWVGRGNVLTARKRYADAMSAHDKAIALMPDLAVAWLGRGNVLYEMMRYGDALAAYDKALALAPDLAGAWFGRGNALFELKRYDESHTAYDRAVAINPGLTQAWNSLGNVLCNLQRHGESIAAYDKALALDPYLKGAAGLRLRSKMAVCNWHKFDIECPDLISSVRNGHAVISPFPFLSLPSSPLDQLQCARQWVTNEFPSGSFQVGASRGLSHDRIRIGYLSADFRNHPVAHGIVELLEHHDHSRFESVGLSINPDDGSDIRARLVRTFDQFHDIGTTSDIEAARLIRELGIDVLVKVAPHTDGSRLGILAHRPAPIQVSGMSAWTSGADFIDYVIADRYTLPFDEQCFYSEKIVHLPNSYFPSDSTQTIAANTMTRAEANLPENAFVFCSFNRSYKLNPQMFDVWMRLLKRVDGSVLWLAQDGDEAAVNLRREAAMRGVEPSRLIFAPRMPLTSDHLARHRLADLFLDSLPYGAHTTARDALWAGLPVLTCRGNTFVGRISASQLQAVGLPELVTDSLDQYEAAALRLAQSPDELRALRDRLANNRLSHPAFDTIRLCRYFEAAYTEMWQRHIRGEPPTSFAVDMQTSKRLAPGLSADSKVALPAKQRDGV
jgi:protein O-GlcNAc transferase